MKSKLTIGFTGTRKGMSHEQLSNTIAVLRACLVSCDAMKVYGLHGDCVGADAQFDAICRGLGLTTNCMPCTFESMRAHCPAEQISEPVAPMARNRAIVATADLIIACPPNKERIKKGSGTWATIGFAEKAGKDVHIIFPDGEVSLRP